MLGVVYNILKECRDTYMRCGGIFNGYVIAKIDESERINKSTTVW